MEIGRDWDSEWRNMWPREADAPGFKRTMLNFYEVRGEYAFSRAQKLPNLS